MKPLKVTILSKSNCHYCEIAKQMFEKLQEEYVFDIEIFDMSTDEGMEQSKKFGFLFPPGILFDDEPFSYGRPSEKKVRKELSRRHLL